ncbi:glycoside hydrolase family 15 protein [Glycomyces buryatensis]|uniref:Glycoside hydrolase family 15 protein n=1 Tax=Glycomyces buryatensis TaxID=2570927 RepID=A0A4S8PWU6_9ACTN|nr:glycoside hydrolase family 15 protein [Glycomyces buryatensis]THV34372.1 glycoside hydrolase family 15 protein [Glycomyces buryatensis]
MRRSDASASRLDGYAPLRDYAAIGDGRTVALVARDGSIDWLPIPDLDSPTVFAAVLDAERGGRFVLEPEVPYRVERRYLPGTNVLETTFHTASGSARVTDALTLPGDGLEPFRELQRRIKGLAGTVRFRWLVEPRFGYGGSNPRFGSRFGLPVASSGAEAVGLIPFDAGASTAGWSGTFETAHGSSHLLVLPIAHQEPLVFPSRRELDARFERTGEIWRRWTAERTYEGPWREAVIRSALALKLLVFAPSGAVAAAATTSLPEQVGGERNWDYRYSWIRDSAFTLQAFLRLGCPAEARAYFWWLMHTTQLDAPRLGVLYRFDGRHPATEHELPLHGYRGSRPVRIGNAAADQFQLDAYGELMQTAWLYAEAGNMIDPDVGRRLGEFADFVAANWRTADSGIWEVRSEPHQFTQSKMMCAVALDRAAQLAERGSLPRRHLDRWLRQAAAIRQFVGSRCFSERRRSYVRFAGGEELDASVLLGLLHGYDDAAGPRLSSTVEAIDTGLAEGALVRRYTGEDGVPGSEGAFLACSFWLVEALARVGRVDEAADRMDELIGLANDVGLYSEEIGPAGEFLGNLPQGLSHLALISAAAAIAEASS